MRTFNELPSSENVGDITFDNEPHDGIMMTERSGGSGSRNSNPSSISSPKVSFPQHHHHEGDHDVTHQEAHEKKKYFFMAVIFFITVLTFGIIVRAAESGDNNQNNPSSILQYKSESELAQMRTTLMKQVDATRIRSTSVEYSRLPHLAGSEINTALAHKTAQLFRDLGFDEVREHVVPATLSVLKYRAVAVMRKRQAGMHPSVAYEAKLDEKNSLNLPKDVWSKILPPMNGYSGSGRAEGRIVWANWGREEDFQKLDLLGIDLKGTIVMTRYGKIFRGNKVHLAAMRGASGVLIVNDPGIVGPGMDQKSNTKKRKVFPEGPWANESNVQRGSVDLGQGDPATPGFASFNDALAPRLTNDELFDEERMEGRPLPKIPVQPLGWGDAQNILKHFSSSDHPLPDDWKDTGFLKELTAGGIGPSKNTFIRMEVRRELEVFNITNVMGILRGGVEPDRTILLGSHRDSWGNAGAVDPISGTSILLEIARILGTHHKATGWRPRRTIQFNSWDGEEWSIIGSDEYVETNIELLRQRAIAYMNLDTAVSGSQKLWADGSPLLQDLFETATKEIPNPKKPSSSVFEMMMSPEKGRSSAYSSPSAGTDTVGFFSIAGVPIIDASFYNDDPNDAYEAVYHSYADTVYWIDKFADPGFLYHAAMSKLYLNIALRLSEPVLLPLSVERYATSVQRWVSDFKSSSRGKLMDWRFMDKAVKCFGECAKIHSKRLGLVNHQLATTSTTSIISPFEIRALNDISFGVERVFLSQSDKETGNQSWFRHVIYTPSPVNSYGSAVMPMISMALAEYEEDRRNHRKKRDVELAIGRIALYIFRAGFFVNSSSVMPPGF